MQRHSPPEKDCPHEARNTQGVHAMAPEEPNYILYNDDFNEAYLYLTNFECEDETFSPSLVNNNFPTKCTVVINSRQ